LEYHAGDMKKSTVWTYNVYRIYPNFIPINCLRVDVSIRLKVILPYLLLTLVIAITGVYVVTKLVSDTFTERLTNQLLDAGRVVSETMGQMEIKHVEAVRNAAFTTGVAAAVAAGDAKEVQNLAWPGFSGTNAETLIILDAKKTELLYIVKQPDNTTRPAEATSGAASLPIVSDLLRNNDPASMPRRQLALDTNQHYYYYTAIPISLKGKVVGVAIAGTALDTILPLLKNTSLADIILYQSDGQVIDSTLETPSDIPSIPADTYTQVVAAAQNVTGENLKITGREYSLARSALRIGSDTLAVFAVVLPSNFVIQASNTGRNTYTIAFGLTVLIVIGIGYFISRLIINPLLSLMRTSLAIADGDLAKRTGIDTKDEIGVLASTFDGMTERLQQRTIELEKTNRILEQMDRTKVSFIAISAHELRTPLTLISGYGQLLEQQASVNPGLAPLAKGLMEGANRMTEVVNSMLDVSRIDNQTLKVLPVDMEIKSTIMQVRSTFEAALIERRLTLTVTGLDDLPPITADPDLLLKVFYHVCMNAIKYTPDGGQIAISGQLIQENPAAPEIEIIVSDTGIGIAAEHLELIFEKFFQIGEVSSHSSGKTKFKGGGPGLGLAIARGIILAHQGRIWAESPGHDETTYPGSKFYVRLPVRQVKNENA
jgi:signal transduction histidine kinase